MIQLTPQQLLEVSDIPESIMESLNKIINKSLHFEPKEDK
jgi:hypothetical protein